MLGKKNQEWFQLPRKKATKDKFVETPISEIKSDHLGKDSRERKKDDELPILDMEPIETKDIIKKICVIGDSGVGKKTILNLIAPFKAEFERYTESIGTAITKYGIKYAFETSDINLLIMVWDVTGKMDFKKLHPSYYKGAEGVIVMADASDGVSIRNIPNWIKAAFDITGPIPLIVIINKIDTIDEKERKALDRRIQELVRIYSAPVYYTTKYGKIEDLKAPFSHLADQLKLRIKKQLKERRFRKAREQYQ
jgi:small GTP-binding protein